MPKLKDDQVPSYRLHKQSGHTIVTLNGPDHLLGPHNSGVSQKRYRQLTSDWLRNRDLPDVRAAATDQKPSRSSCSHSGSTQRYYRKPDGTKTSEVGVYRGLLRLL